MDTHRKNVLQSIMWDYDISPEEVDHLIDGTSAMAGHYNLGSLFIKMASGLPWFTILEIFGPQKSKELLKEENLRKIWPKSVQEKYRYVSKRLQEALPDPA